MKLPKTYKGYVLSLSLLGVVLMLPCSMQAQENEGPETISSQKTREKYLDMADKALNSGNEEVQTKISQVTNPFEVYVPTVVEEEPESTQPTDFIIETTKTPSRVARMPDEDALELLAKRITPNVKGTIVMGSKSFLLLNDGQRIPLGTEIPGTVRGEDYVVVVQEITMSDYTLRLNDAEYTASLLESRSDAIQFDRN